jgi:hypothetical protein
MAFSNPIVGGEGGELKRDSIKSPNYIPNVQGWSINRDGTAEFNDVTVRGDLLIGTPPSPPNAYIHGAVLAGIPTIAIYDGTHVDPARIRGYDIGGAGGLVLDTGSVLAENTALALGGNIAELIYENAVGNFEFAFFKVGPPYNEALKMRVTSVISQDLEFGFDTLNPTPDLIGGRMYTFGEILMHQLSPDANYANRVADGKAPGVITATAIGAADTNIATANASNVYLEDGWAYRAIVQIDQYQTAAAGAGTQRHDYKLWEGAVGGTQLGGTNRKFIAGAVTNSRNTVTLEFIWRQVGTSLGTINLSALRGVGAIATSVEVNSSYSLVIEKIGDANKIGAL